MKQILDYICAVIRQKIALKNAGWLSFSQCRSFEKRTAVFLTAAGVLMSFPWTEIVSVEMVCRQKDYYVSNNLQ